MIVSMTFKLNDRQLERAKEIMCQTNVVFHKALDNFPMENTVVDNNETIISYYDDICGKHYVWFGDVLGFLKVSGKNNIPHINARVSLKRLIVIGERDIITQQEIVDKIAAILGKSWRVAEPEILGNEPIVELFWWETVEHYAQWRSNWDTYFSWLAPQIDPEKGIQKFDDRFHHENECLQLLKVGKLIEARQRFPNLADQILTII